MFIRMVHLLMVVLKLAKLPRPLVLMALCNQRYDCCCFLELLISI